MRAYSYLRFSTPEQAAGDSFRRQHDGALAYCRQRGLTLDTELTFHDLGVSAFRGANAETGRLRDFMQAVEDGLVPRGSWLLVESLDRISRATPRKAVRLLEDIVDMGVTVVTLSDQRVYDRKALDEDPTAFLVAFLVAIRANEESATKQRRLKAAWSAKRARAGDRPLTAICPAWLRLEGAGFVLIDDRAEVVRRIYHEAAEGTGASAIAARLNADGVVPFGRAAMWHASYVKKILGNPATIGEFTPHTLERDEPASRRRIPQQTIRGYFPAVVSTELYADVTAQRGGRATGTRSTTRLASLVATLARCASCGSTMTRVMKGSSKKAGRAKLVCTRARAKSGCTDYRSVDLESVEHCIVTQAGEIGAQCPSGDAKADDELEIARTNVEALEHAVSVLIDEMISGKPSAAIRDRLAATEHELDLAREELRRAERSAAINDRIDIARRVEEALSILNAVPLDRNKANAALKRLFSDAVVDPENIRLAWRHAPGAEPLRLMHSFPKNDD